jgi:hypothetical protein
MIVTKVRLTKNYALFKKLLFKDTILYVSGDYHVEGHGRCSEVYSEEGTYLGLIRGTYDKLPVDIVWGDE